MLVPNEVILKSINNLNNSGNEDWEVFKTWVSNTYFVETTMLIDAEEDRSAATFAGRCRELKELWHYLERAKDILNSQPPEEKQVVSELTPEEAASLFD